MLLPDVNVLGYAHRRTDAPTHREDEKTHRAHRSWLEQLAGGREPLGLSVLVAVAFVRIVTNEKIYEDPTPLALALAAMDQLAALLVAGIRAAYRGVLGSRRMGHRSWMRAGGGAGLFFALGVLGWSAWAAADEVGVPVQLQVDLLAKVVAYDKNFSERAHDRVRVLILEKSGNDDSKYVASQAGKAMLARRDLGGLPAEISTLAFTDAAAVATQCRTNHVSVLYLASGFGDAEIQQIVGALDGVSVLTAGAVAKFVPRGIVLGFDLVGGKPKLLVHLDQAKRQHVDFSAQMLKLVKTFP